MVNKVLFWVDLLCVSGRALRVPLPVRFLHLWPFSSQAGSHILTSGTGYWLKRVMKNMQRMGWLSRKTEETSFSSSAFPAISLDFILFLRGWDFCECDRFFNPTIKVVTFCLHGWCMLGVFLLPAFTPQGHDCQDLLSLCDGMHVCTV